MGLSSNCIFSSVINFLNTPNCKIKSIISAETSESELHANFAVEDFKLHTFFTILEDVVSTWVFLSVG